MLALFRDKYSNPATGDAIGRVNRSISAWPTISGEDPEPMESFETVKTTHRKLSSGLNEIKTTAEAEAHAIDKALEALSVLIALRKAPETAAQLDKRNKRHRGSSPLSTPSTPVPTPVNKITLTVKANSDRSSEGPTAPSVPFKQDAKARTKFYSKQLPLQKDRKVAFHPPSISGKEGAAEAEENTWILAVVTRCLNHEKNRYEVQDAESQEDGQPGQLYTANLKTIMPLPDPDAPPNSPSHPNAYPIFSAGSTVMALYPDTSCFYRAVVAEVQGPREPTSRNTPTVKQVYRLRFEDDDDQVHSVPAHWVVEWPGS